MINSEYWYNSEKLLNYIWPVIIAVSCIICFVLIGVLVGYSKNSKKKVIIFFIGTIAVNIIIGASIMIYTNSYRDLDQYITYKNRNYDVTIFNKNSLTKREIKGYSLEDIQGTSELPFYTQKNNVNTDEWNYLGCDEHLYFFKNQSGIFNVNITDDRVTFENNTNSDVSMKETYAELNDKSFLNMGFKEKVGPTIEKIIIDNRLKNKEYKNTNKTKKLIEY